MDDGALEHVVVPCLSTAPSARPASSRAPHRARSSLQLGAGCNGIVRAGHGVDQFRSVVSMSRLHDSCRTVGSTGDKLGASAMRHGEKVVRVASSLAALCTILVIGLPVPLWAFTPVVTVPTAAPNDVHPARVVGSSVERKPSMRWLVVASRASPAEAIAYARDFSASVAPALVVPSSTSWYAVLAGELDMPKGEANLDNLRGLRLIPQDSYLSTGARFGPVVWSGYAVGADHDVMD